MLAVAGTIRQVPARLPVEGARHRSLLVAWIALSLFASFRLAGMSIFMLDAGQLEYAVNSTIRTSWTVSDPETQSADTLLGTLQTGNVHGLIVAVCVLAMVAFERKQGWLGGPRLGFAILSKLFPGVLLVYLLLRRQWRAVIWTLAAIVALSLATLLLFGVEPFASFVHFQSKLRGSPGARPLASRQEPCVRSKPTCP